MSFLNTEAWEFPLQALPSKELLEDISLQEIPQSAHCLVLRAGKAHFWPLNSLISQGPCGVEAVITPVLQLGKLRTREMRSSR